MNDVIDRVKEVASSVLFLDKELLVDSSSSDTIDEWDSLKQMNIVLALEEEFEIFFSEDEIIELLNIALMTEVISQKVK